MGIRIVVCIAAVFLACSVASGNTLTFDNLPSGSKIQFSRYSYDNRIYFSGNFRVTDHSASTWGAPHSGSNVMKMVENTSALNYISFGYFSSIADIDSIQSISAYFSTDLGKIVKMTTYNDLYGTMVPITSIIIGAPGESWHNRYVEINASPNKPFDQLRFESVNSPDDLLGFCMDDFTFTPVPEPSSFMALAGGLAGMVLRRRRN